MHASVVLRIALCDRDKGRLPAQELHDRAERLMEELLAIEEAGARISDVATSSDSDEASILIEARVSGADETSVVQTFVECFEIAIRESLSATEASADYANFDKRELRIIYR
jgi:hypothetical protein